MENPGVIEQASLDPDDKEIPFTGNNLSLFAAAVLLATGGNPITYKEANRGDLLQRGADLILAELREGKRAATGVNPDTMLREPIPMIMWEHAHYGQPSGSRGHWIAFVDYFDGPESKVLGLGGSLFLHGQTGVARWQMITVENVELRRAAQVGPFDRADPFQEPTWTLGMAVAWIAWRSPEAVRNTDASVVEMMMTESTDVIDRAWSELKTRLEAGKATASAIMVETGEVVEVPALEWPYLRHTGGQSLEDRFGLPDPHLGPTVRGAKISICDAKARGHDARMATN